jgi:hypothetical protein
MFGFGKTPRDPLADARSAERWLAQLPPNDPLLGQAEIVAALGRASDRSAERTPQRLEAVFRVDVETRALHRSLTAQYIEHARRSSKIENQIWQAMFDLAQSFLVCYTLYGQEIADRGQSSKWKSLFPELIARQVAHLGIDLEVRLFRYEPWIPAKWIELHDLFAAACSRQIERLPLTLDPGSDPTTIEHQYLNVLCLQLLNPGNLTARQIAGIGGEINQWTESLRLSLETPPVASFYVDLGSRTGLRRRGPAPLEGRVLFVDTRPLHALLREQLAGLEQKVRADPMSDKTGRRAEQHALLAKLVAQADPEYRPFPRRGERTPATGEMDAIVGFAKIAGFLREEERAPVPEFEPGHSYGGTLELAVFGHARHEADRRQELVRRRFEAFAAPGGPWEIKDVSHSGFRLVAPMGIATRITLGTLAALRARGQASWTLGVVRRMRRLTAERAEIGLQILASTLIAVTLAEHRGGAEADNDVESEASSGRFRSFDGLFLALRRRDAGTAVQSLIIPAGEYHPARRIRLQTPKASYPVRFGSLLEQAPEWVWVAIEPIDLSVGGGKAEAPERPA